MPLDDLRFETLEEPSKGQDEEVEHFELQLLGVVQCCTCFIMFYIVLLHFQPESSRVAQTSSRDVDPNDPRLQSSHRAENQTLEADVKDFLIIFAGTGWLNQSQVPEKNNCNWATT